MCYSSLKGSCVHISSLYFKKITNFLLKNCGFSKKMQFIQLMREFHKTIIYSTATFFEKYLLYLGIPRPIRPNWSRDPLVK